MMINNIFNFIEKNSLILPNSKILVGLSGGPDSVFLLYILKKFKNKINFELITAHLDHEWREDSYKDVEFCKKITSELNVPFFSAKISELNFSFKLEGSKEELGRKMRRAYFEKIAKENNVGKIALAHHLNDQEETFFIRLIRGTSLSGLTCMWPLDGVYIRPLLEIKKSDILEYLNKNNIPFFEDPSNISQEFLRNRIRNKVIPELQQCDSRFDNNFLRTLNKLQETEIFLEAIIEHKFKEISTQNEDLFEINLNEFFKLNQFLQNKILFLWLIKSQIKFELTETFLMEILRFLKQPKNGTHKIHLCWSIEKLNNKAKIKKII